MKETIKHFSSDAIQFGAIGLSLFGNVEAWLRYAALILAIISAALSIRWKWRHRKD